MTDKIRNFCIIAHIDHGKSTIADRMMEITGTVSHREMKSQLLDSMELEREKGITIKLAPVQMHWKGYELNLIDTPGHVDFSYEVSRSLQAVETAVLVVDATQGIQAQTLANVYLALEQDLYIIPVINKIDLPAADVEKVSAQIVNLLGCKSEDIILASGKTGQGVPEILDTIINRAPAPRTFTKVSAEDSGTSTEWRVEGVANSPEHIKAEPGQNHGPSEARDSILRGSPALENSNPRSHPCTRALIFDSYFDDYRGVVLYVRVFDGEIPKNSEIRMMAAAANGLALEVGALTPKMTPQDQLSTGDIGYIVTNLKTTREAKVGDTVTLAKHPATPPLPGYKNVLPFVYAGFFPGLQ